MNSNLIEKQRKINVINLNKKQVIEKYMNRTISSTVCELKPHHELRLPQQKSHNSQEHRGYRGHELISCL